MKKTQLAELIRKIIQEELSIMDEESQAAKDAKAQGLTSMGFGRWGKDGKVTHKTDRGRLTPVQSDKDVGLRPGKTAATKDKFYRAMPSRGDSSVNTRAAAIKGPDGKLQRAEPKWTPDVNRERNKPQDALQHTQTTDRILNKVWDKVSSSIEDGETLTRDEILQRTKLPEKALDYGLKHIESEDKDYPGFVDNGDGTYTVNHGN